MKPKYFLVVTGIVAAIVGILFIIFQGNAMGLAGAMGSGVIAQILGANFVGFGVLNILGNDLKEKESMRIILLANLISELLGFLIMLYVGLTSGLTTLGWIATAVYLVFSLGFGYFLIAQPSRSTATVPCPAEPC